MENMEFKVAVSKTLASFLCGCSATANEKALEQHELQAMKYLVDQGIISLDMPDKISKDMTANDKAGRYRLNESHRVKAEKLSVHFETEINAIRRSN